LLSGQRGLAIDNLISAQIVTQPHLEVPSVLTCSKEENTDLFWAIRGGGGNFGIMTEMTLKIWPQEEDVFLGTVSFDPTDETLEKFANSVQEWAGSKLNGKCHMDIGARREVIDSSPVNRFQIESC
jgi:FAD/FMN-containing dehydrogenase